VGAPRAVEDDGSRQQGVEVGKGAGHSRVFLACFSTHFLSALMLSGFPTSGSARRRSLSLSLSL